MAETFPSDTLTEQVRSCLERWQVRNTRVLLGLSGGADSTALCLALCRLRLELALEVRAIHFNHGWRAESSAEARWVADLCRRLSVELTIETHHSAGRPESARAGSEEQARQWRYCSLEEWSETLDVPWVLLAHTRDDQVETILHRILRGTGLRGLAGMRESRPLGRARLLRPLLGAQRTNVEEFLHTQGQAWCNDATNQDLRWTRNRIRQRLLPQLREDFQPCLDTVLLRLAEQASEAVEFIEEAAERICKRAVLESQPRLQKWDVAALQEVPSYLLREAFRNRWRLLRWSEQAMTDEHWHALARLVSQPEPAARSFPGGIRGVRRGGLLILEHPGGVERKRGKPETLAAEVSPPSLDSRTDPLDNRAAEGDHPE